MPLSVKDGMGAWVDDFKKSDAPQFKGKSEKERREMAMAAYLSAKKGQKDEGFVSAAQRKAVWANKADGGKGHPDNKKNEATDKPPFTPDPPEAEKKNSDGTKTSPMSRAKQLAKMARDRNMKNEATVDTADIASKKAMKKSDTEKLGKLADMLAKEKKPKTEAKLDELSPATHKSYQAKAFTSGAKGMAAKRMGTMSAKDAYDNEKKRHDGIELSKSLQRRDARKKRNEEVDKVKLKGFGPDHAKGNMGNPAARAALGKRMKDNEKARQALKDPDHNPSWANSKSKTEAKSFDQKFRDHLKFSMSKSPAVQAYMKKRRDDRDARHAKQDPAAVKKNYGPAVVPPGTAYNKARKKGMNPSAAADAVSGAFKNKAKRDGKLPK